MVQNTFYLNKIKANGLCLHTNKNYSVLFDETTGTVTKIGEKFTENELKYEYNYPYRFDGKENLNCWQVLTEIKKRDIITNFKSIQINN